MFWIYDYVKGRYQKFETTNKKNATPTIHLLSLPPGIDGSDKGIAKPKDQANLLSLKDKEDLRMMLDWWTKRRVESGIYE